MFAAREPSDIDRFFRGLTEYAFHTRLGVVDPPLVDYVARLLVRFLRNEPAASVTAPDAAEVARLLVEAQWHDAVEAREEFRQIGDTTLFWSGLYPEAVARRPTAGEAMRMQLLEYREAGRRAYWLAATIDIEPADAPDCGEDDGLLLERLAREYDVCVRGLGEVRRAWGDAA
jgi:hypothetical protein